MKAPALGIFAVLVLLSSGLNAEDSAPQTHREKNLERMQADRRADNANTLEAQKQYRQGSAALAVHDKQQQKDVQQLKSAEVQVTAGKKQKAESRQTYKDAVDHYGSSDPKAQAAKADWIESKAAMAPLLQNRETQKDNVQDSGRQVHNDKTVLSVQKRDLESGASYRAADDRKIKKEEEHIADDHKAMAEKVSAKQP